MLARRDGKLERAHSHPFSVQVHANVLRGGPDVDEPDPHAGFLLEVDGDAAGTAFDLLIEGALVGVVEDDLVGRIAEAPNFQGGDAALFSVDEDLDSGGNGFDHEDALGGSSHFEPGGALEHLALALFLLFALVSRLLVGRLLVSRGAACSSAAGVSSAAGAASSSSTTAGGSPSAARADAWKPAENRTVSARRSAGAVAILKKRAKNAFSLMSPSILRTARRLPLPTRFFTG